MSSHARPCYQNLSQYTQNGLVPILAPSPAETKPQIFNQFTPHQFSQAQYHMHMRSLNRNLSSGTSYHRSIGYANYTDTGCGSASINQGSVPYSGSVTPGTGSASVTPGVSSNSVQKSASINQGSVPYSGSVTPGTGSASVTPGVSSNSVQKSASKIGNYSNSVTGNVLKRQTENFAPGFNEVSRR